MEELSEEFDDALHQFFQFGRIKQADSEQEKEQVAEFRSELEKVMALAGNSNAAWKTLLLSIIHKRYHRLSPTCKAQLLAEKEDGKKDIAAAAGDGERRFFYEAVQYLYDTNHVVPATALVKIATLAGGSRDLCTILPNLVASACKDATTTVVSPSSSTGSGSSCFCLAQETAKCLQLLQDSPDAIIGLTVEQIASTLDQDLVVVDEQKTGEKKDQTDKKERVLPSTLHVFLPHRGRGRKKKSKEARQSSGNREHTKRELWNTVSEVLIWKHTEHANREAAFDPCYRRLLLSSSTMEDRKKMLGILQTITRKLRKKLNDYGREQGMMLTDQYALDAAKLCLRQVQRGKEGDLNFLTKRATKKSDTRILRLIVARNAANPTKIVKFASVHEVCERTHEEDPDIVELQRAIFQDRLSATIKHLRGFVKEQAKSSLVVSMEAKSTEQHVAAVLVAAAMSTWKLEKEASEEDMEPLLGSKPCKKTSPEEMEQVLESTAATSNDEATRNNGKVRLILAGKEYKIASLVEVVELLSQIKQGLIKNEDEVDAPSFMQDGVATTKAVINLIDRHLKESETLVLLTAADVQLPEDALKSLTARGAGVHVHDGEGLRGRLFREGARQGDVTVSLAWDTMDDLDLHVFVPSGEEICYSDRESKDGLCVLDVDMNAGSPFSKEPVENVFLGNRDTQEEAPQGKYKVVVQNFAYHDDRFGEGDDRGIDFRITVDKNGVKEKFTGTCKSSRSESDVVVCEFEYQGRTIPWKKEKEGSAFGASNMVNLTSSTGSTLESLGQLVQATQQLAHMDTVRTLVGSEEDGSEEDGSEEDGRMDVDNEHNEPMDVEARPVQAGQGHFEVTSRDRMRILLAKLPKVFHEIVGEAYGGPTLADICAREISERMVAEKIPLSELKGSEYPQEIIDAVKVAMVATDA